jgi:hypothetical protein
VKESKILLEKYNLADHVNDDIAIFLRFAVMAVS